MTSRRSATLRPRRLWRRIRHLSEEQLAALGVSHIAYVKPVMVNGEQGFAIHAADGTPMAVTDNRYVAIAAILQHEMLPLSVH